MIGACKSGRCFSLVLSLAEPGSIEQEQYVVHL
jgi:hypothetical protein